ncbi:hypothetical protein MTR67_009905 [Solanum verrucosum]|uniref:HMG box domain-containing protein n=2 Tax=Solanum TaxID=4107 RepID=A0AAF0Q6K6_SOLVR|nr:hypothetical protein MTR67_009905 [Solanum verrucosum]
MRETRFRWFGHVKMRCERLVVRGGKPYGALLTDSVEFSPFSAGSAPILNGFRVFVAGFIMKGAKSKAKADTKLGVRKKATESKKAKNAAKDPNKPKRPPSAFFVFMEEFRKTYKEKHPNNKSVAVVGKAGGDKWKQLTDEEKAPYQAKAEKRKAEYQKNMDAYNKKLAAGDADDEESDKSKSEVHDDDEDDDGSEEEDDD